MFRGGVSGCGAESDSCTSITPCAGKRRGGGGSEDRGGQGAGGGALPRVAPPVSPKAPSDDSGVAQVQSCLSRRQVTPTVPGCGGRFDGGESSLAD